MDRKMIYPGQIPLETDLLDTNRFALIGLGKLAAAVLGTTTLVNGLACTPTAPASMQVQVAPGEIYSLQNLDGTAYSSLAADTTHQILKQGLLMDAATLSCPAPATAGQSINYLVQATYQDIDSNAVVLPYYNASNPTQAYTGPNNSGTAQNTVRKGVCAVSVKAGIAATTGTQTTPAPDSGYTGLFVVTVAYGQSTINAGNISTASGAPFLNSTLLGLAPAFTAIPTSPTPSQFDNSTKSATTAFVQRALGNHAGSVSYSTAGSIAASDVGKLIICSNTVPFTLTLPLLSAVPDGATLKLVNYNSGTVTLQRAGTDALAYGGGALASITIPTNYSLVLAVSNGAWQISNGDKALDFSPLFASSKTSNGYQKLPGGLIIQWGSSAVPASSSPLVVTLPIAFPNGFLQGSTTMGGAASSNAVAGMDQLGASPTTQITLYQSTAGSQTVRWIVIGY